MLNVFQNILNFSLTIGMRYEKFLIGDLIVRFFFKSSTKYVDMWHVENYLELLNL